MQCMPKRLMLLTTALADVVGQNQEITALAVAVARMRAEDALDAEAQALEDRPASLLLFQHLNDHLVHAQVARGVEDRLSQRGAQPAAPPMRVDQQDDVGDMIRPARQPAHGAVADDRIADHRHDLAPVLGQACIDQPRDDVRVLEIIFEIEQIVQWQAAPNASNATRSSSASDLITTAR